MKLKAFILSSIFIIVVSLVGSEFTLPKNVTVIEQVKPAKKTRELILEQIGDILKNLLDNDKLSLDLRAFFQDELEICLVGDKISLIGSSSKSKLQETLDLLVEINQNLTEQAKKTKNLKNKIKNLKAEKLKG